MTWQQRQENLYLDRLRERWNEDGTRKGLSDAEILMEANHRHTQWLWDRYMPETLSNNQRTVIYGSTKNDLCNQ